MNTIIWVVQCISATIFGISGLLKLVTPKDILEEKIGWLRDYSALTVRFIGLCELLGAIGLVVPMALDIFPIFTPIAATGLVIIMLLGARAHLIRKEYKKISVDLLFFVLALFIAIERF